MSEVPPSSRTTPPPSSRAQSWDPEIQSDMEDGVDMIVDAQGMKPPRPHSRKKTGGRLPQRFDADAPLFLISTAARLAGMHPQTLRTYDRLGLVTPKRTSGKGRRYSIRDVEKLRLVQYLTQDEGINLVGVRHILTLRAEVERLQEQTAALAEELRQAQRSTTSSRVFTASSESVWLRTRRREILP